MKQINSLRKVLVTAYQKMHNTDFNYHIKVVAKLAGITQRIRFSHKKGNQTIVTTKPSDQISIVSYKAFGFEHPLDGL